MINETEYANNPLTKEQENQIDALFAQYDRNDAPGCAVGVIKDYMNNLVGKKLFLSFILLITLKLFSADSLSFVVGNEKYIKKGKNDFILTISNGVKENKLVIERESEQDEYFIGTYEANLSEDDFISLLINEQNTDHNLRDYGLDGRIKVFYLPKGHNKLEWTYFNYGSEDNYFKAYDLKFEPIMQNIKIDGKTDLLETLSVWDKVYKADKYSMQEYSLDVSDTTLLCINYRNGVNY